MNKSSNKVRSLKDHYFNKIICNPGNGSEPFCTEFPINDYPSSVREHLSSAATQQEIREGTGATVKTRGTFIHEKMKGKRGFEKAKPLYLFITSYKRSNVECAVAVIIEKLEQILARPYYQEKILIGLDDVGPGFDVVSQLGGEGGSNLKYISNETGAVVSIRGRGSGFIEPLAGRESSDPMHILVEHQDSCEKIGIACRLAYDLLQSVKEDWYQIQKQQNQSRGAVQSLYRRGEHKEEGRAPYGFRRGGEYDRDDGNVHHSRDSGKLHKSTYRLDDLDGKYKDKPYYSDFPGTFDRSSNNEKKRVDCHQDSNSDKYCENIFKSGGSHEDDYFQRNDGWEDRPKRGYTSDWESGKKDKLGGESWSQQNTHQIWQNSSHRENNSKNYQAKIWETTGSHFDEDKKYWTFTDTDDYSQQTRDDQDWSRQTRGDKWQGGGARKKSRWTTSSPDNIDSPVSDNAMLGRVLDQKRKIDQQLEKFREIKDCLPHLASVNSLENPFLEDVSVWQMTQHQLQNLNPGQLMQVSQQQQAFLLQITENISNQQSLTSSVSEPIANISDNAFCNLKMNPFLNCDGLSPLSNIQRAQSSNTSSTYQRGTYCSDNEKSAQAYCDLQREKHSFDASPPRMSNRDYRGRIESSDFSLQRCSPQNIWERTRSSSQERYNRERANHSPKKKGDIPCLMEVRCSPPLHAGNERYSPQLDDGQERYSPQLEDDNRRSPELFERRIDPSLSKPRDHRMEKSKDMKNKFREMQKFRVAVIDKNLNKLTSRDGNNIRSWVFKSQHSLPRGKNYNVEFVGLTSHNFVFVIMPYTLEGMKWFVDFSSFKCDDKKYILLPFDDLYNRYKMKGTIYLDLTPRYGLNSEEVIVELGRQNEGLNTDLWKMISFNEEKFGFFFVVTVDLFSYLILKKMFWKPRFKQIDIKLEPFSTEYNIGNHFF